MMRASVRDRLRAGGPRRCEGVCAPLADSARIVVHVDMDAFFAAIEERDNPGLHGKPVIVGGPKGSRGVVTTANYVARQYGIHAGMSLAEADRRCPEVHHVSTRGGKYTSVSLDLMEVLRRFSPRVEPYSIDEAFLDGTGCEALFGSPLEYGRAIQHEIQETLRLTASVGIGPSRIIAKIGSGLNKPAGLTFIPTEKVLAVLGPLPVRKVPGVGPSTEARLHQLNICTIEDLLTCPEELLSRQLGVHGRDLQQILRGDKGNRVIALEERPDDKSMGHEHTFSKDVASQDVIHGQLLHLCERASRRMRRENYFGRVVTLRLRTSDFTTRDHQRALRTWTQDPGEVYNTARELLADLWRPGDMPVRLIGVSVSQLVRPSERFGLQEDAFLQSQRIRRSRMFQAVDMIRDVYGEDAVGLCGSLKSRLRRANPAMGAQLEHSDKVREMRKSGR